MKADDSRHADWVQAAVDRYSGPLTRYAVLITGDLDRARDVVQDTFLRLCSQNESRVRDHLAEWLFAVCRNRALDVVRKENRMKPLEEELQSRPSPEVSPAQAAERRELNHRVLQMLAALPRNQQEVVRLKFQNGLSYEEISRVTQLTVSNVGFLIHTAIKTLRQQLHTELNLVPNPLRRTP